MSEKDRIAIREIVDDDVAIDKLEMYVIKQRIEAMGWCYAHCCNLLDKGVDPRYVGYQSIIDEWSKRDRMWLIEGKMGI